MKHEINPKTTAIVIAVLAVVVLGLGYRIFFSAPAAPPPPAETPQNKQFMHPMGPDTIFPGATRPGGAPGQTAAPGQTGQ